jgi:shikimate 5-dehydrogenase
MPKNETIILNKEDIDHSKQPGLWNFFLETLGVDYDAKQVCLSLSPLDYNKKVD